MHKAIADGVLVVLRNAECHLLDRDDWESDGVREARIILCAARVKVSGLKGKG